MPRRQPERESESVSESVRGAAAGASVGAVASAVPHFAIPSSRQLPAAARYGVAAVAPVLALLTALALGPLLDTYTVMTFALAVVVSGWLGGFGPGLTATALSVLLLDYFLVAPLNSFGPLAPGDLVRLSLFSLMGLVASAASQSLRTARERADESAREAALYAEQLQEQGMELEEHASELKLLAGEAVERSNLLRMGEERFRATFEQAAVGMAHVGTDGRWLRVNRRLCEIVGYAPQELMRLTFRDIAHPDDFADDARERRRLLAAEIPHYSIETRYRRRDGTVVWINRTVSLVRRADGSPDYFISVAEDESERKAAEEALRLANRELSSTTYAIAHDLRSPLRAIDGYSYLLLAGHGAALDDEAREQLRRIRATTRRMGELLDGLLTLARLGRDSLTRERVDLGTLARAVLDDLTSAEPGRRVEARIADGLEAHADRRLLALVMQNVVGNAWKFSAGQDPAVIELSARDAERERVFAVRDNGVGFYPTQEGLLFRPFHRLHRDDEFAGHGLGLATVQRIVERHGGRVWAEGEPGAGATVYFTLEPPGARAPTDASPREPARD